MNPVDKFKKNLLISRYWLTGRAAGDPRFYTALEALDHAAKYHIGFRNDGVTPEFDHQISIFMFVKTLEPHLIFPMETYATIFLHDLPEDYAKDHPEARYDYIQAKFGTLICEATYRLTKKYMGSKKDIKQYFLEISQCPIASIAKPSDRLLNQGTMTGVFTLAKQVEYIDETKDNFFDAIKRARRMFPRQDGAYENVKAALWSQIDLLERAIEAEKALL